MASKKASRNASPFDKTLASGRRGRFDRNEILGKSLQTNLAKFRRIRAVLHCGNLADLRNGGKLWNLAANLFGNTHLIADGEFSAVEQRIESFEQHRQRYTIDFADTGDRMRFADCAIRAAAEMEAREDATSARMEREGLIDGHFGGKTLFAHGRNVRLLHRIHLATTWRMPRRLRPARSSRVAGGVRAARLAARPAEAERGAELQHLRRSAVSLDEMRDEPFEYNESTDDDKQAMA